MLMLLAFASTLLISFFSPPSASSSTTTLSSSLTSPVHHYVTTTREEKGPSSSSSYVLKGEWDNAKSNLRDPNCCVVTVSGLEDSMMILQKQWSQKPTDVDLRSRIRVRNDDNNDDDDDDLTYQDCLRVYNMISPQRQCNDDGVVTDPRIIVEALEELARGVVALADGPLEGVCNDVFMRIVCASTYNARDPMYHTDKAPLRGYVTLCGPGTDFMTRPCNNSMEYAMLRGFGIDPGEPEPKKKQSIIRRANELEFIVMKGDYYKASSSSSSITTTTTTTDTTSIFPSLCNIPPHIWNRASSCVHRSPPTTKSQRRVIVSLDLADGDDDREWYQIHTKREWRSGMTQRKSRLVA